MSTHIKSRKHVTRHYAQGPSLAAASLLAGMALATPLRAADLPGPGSAADAAATLDTIEVNGVRRKAYTADHVSSPKFTQPLLDTTQTINVIGSDLFNQQGATTLTDALRNSPGVGTFYAGENGTTSTGDAVFMRGFDSSGSIFVDGVRDLGSVSRDVFNIEQIEVTKGPAGTDYGRTAPTGAINMVTKQAGLRDSMGGNIAWGSAGQRRVTADWNQAIGADAAFRLNLMAQDGGVPGRDVVERNRWGLAPSLAFGLGTANRLYIDLLHVQQANVPDGGVPTIGLPGYVSPDPARPQIGVAPRVDSSNFYGTRSDHDDVTADMVTVVFEHEFEFDATLQNTTRWGSNRQDYMLTSFMASADPTRFMTPDLDDPTTWTLARSLPTFKDQRNTILANQTNVRAHFVSGSVANDLSAGVELMREELQTRGQAALAGSAWPAADLYAPDPDVSGLSWAHDGTSGDGRTDTVAAYAFDTLKLGSRWQLNGGVRVDRYRTDFSNRVVCGGRNTPACGLLPVGSVVQGVDDSVSGTLTSWKFGALYKPSENGSVYANYAIAQQPPGGGGLELSAAANNANNPVFDPQKARTAEIGTKWNLLGGRLLVTGALYDTRVSNEIVQDPIDQLYYQTGEKRVRGIELSAAGNLTEAWSVSTGFTTMDADVVTGTSVSADGSTALAYTPRSAFTAWTSYRFASGFAFGGGVRYSGAMQRGSDSAIGTPDHTEAWWVWDAVASYAFNDHVDLRLNLYNLFDKDYVAAINKSGYRYTPGTPRSVMFTANFHF